MMVEGQKADTNVSYEAFLKRKNYIYNQEDDEFELDL